MHDLIESLGVDLGPRILKKRWKVGDDDGSRIQARLKRDEGSDVTMGSGGAGEDGLKGDRCEVWRAKNLVDGGEGGSKTSGDGKATVPNTRHRFLERSDLPVQQVPCLELRLVWPLILSVGSWGPDAVTLGEQPPLDAKWRFDPVAFHSLDGLGKPLEGDGTARSSTKDGGDDSVDPGGEKFRVELVVKTRDLEVILPLGVGQERAELREKLDLED